MIWGGQQLAGISTSLTSFVPSLVIDRSRGALPDSQVSASIAAFIALTVAVSPGLARRLSRCSSPMWASSAMSTPITALSTGEFVRAGVLHRERGEPFRGGFRPGQRDRQPERDRASEQCRAGGGHGGVGGQGHAFTPGPDFAAGFDEGCPCPHVYSRPEARACRRHLRRSLDQLVSSERRLLTVVESGGPARRRRGCAAVALAVA